MAGKLVHLGNPQKTVFTMLAAVLLLEFGSLSKLQKIWGLAFGSSAPAGTTTPTSTSTAPATSSSGSVNLTATHPGGTVSL